MVAIKHFNIFFIFLLLIGLESVRREMRDIWNKFSDAMLMCEVNLLK